MKVETNQAGVDQLHRQLDDAGARGMEDVRAEIQTRAPRVTGEYAGSFVVTTSVDGSVSHHAVASQLPQAGAVERGADVGPRRGPHMAGSFTVRDAGARWPDHVTRRLRDG